MPTAGESPDFNIGHVSFGGIDHSFGEHNIFLGNPYYQSWETNW
uniref:Uncharacterized protein n=1 Tax=Rhizophora mucronata TaxID=61149 RepID=A0A2P2JHV7_RHIMU